MWPRRLFRDVRSWKCLVRCVVTGEAKEEWTRIKDFEENTDKRKTGIIETQVSQRILLKTPVWILKNDPGGSTEAEEEQRHSSGPIRVKPRTLVLSYLSYPRPSPGPTRRNVYEVYARRGMIEALSLWTFVCGIRHHFLP